MQLLDDLIVVATTDNLSILTWKQLKTTGKLLGYYPDDLQGARFLKSFNGELLFYKYDGTQHFYRLYKEDKKTKILECAVIGSDLPGEKLICWHHAFHAKANCTIFMFCDKHRARYSLGLMSHQSKPMPFVLSDIMPDEFEQLVSFQDSVLLCHIDNKKHLKLQRIDIQDAQITLVPLDLKRRLEREFTGITNTFVHLDKLFIIGCVQGYEENDYYLIIVDMTTIAIESTTKIDPESFGASIISSSLGKIHIAKQVKNTIKVFNIDYT